MIREEIPDITLRILEAAGCFSKDQLLSEKAAYALDLNYKGVSKNKPNYTCIAEVDFSPAPGKQQHFVVIHNGEIIDPWTGDEPHRDYEIINYRLFRVPNDDLIQDAKKTWKNLDKIETTNKVDAARIKRAKEFVHNFAEYLRKN
jgi:hypothetical protein